MAVPAVRRAGVLLHPTSLPGDSYTGDFGLEARRFIDHLAASGLSIWQILPIGPTQDDGCPYQSSSVHAGNPDLISMEWLVEYGLLDDSQAEEGKRGPDGKRRALDQAAAVFFKQLSGVTQSSLAAVYLEFIEEADFWLEDYVRFQAFRDAAQRQPWTTWETGLRNCEPATCAQRATELADQLNRLRFRQFVFHRQWLELKAYANEHGVLLFGDMPIYVHLESADVWAHQEQFDLDANGQPATVTGVPPDYFSDQGQLWGNPQYNWPYMLEHDFDWWLKRFTSADRMFDIVRIDHFRALDAYWEIPADSTSAINGRWVKSPGRELLALVRTHCPKLRLVAENLGIISPEVEALREQFHLPGMLILQFAFDGNPDNPYLLDKHEENEVVYTGTHDNNTSLGWFLSLDEQTRQRVCDYFECAPSEMPWAMVERAMASPATTAIAPWQDLLGLDGNHRMNTPGTTQGNWHWRFDWAQVTEDLAPRTLAMVRQYNRQPRA